MECYRLTQNFNNLKELDKGVGNNQIKEKGGGGLHKNKKFTMAL